MPPKSPAEIDAEKARKPRPDLVPARAILAAGRAMAYGVSKHGPGQTGRGTYRDPGEQGRPETHMASCLRHMLAYLCGETHDSDSGLAHLDCATAHLCMVVDLVEDPVRATVDKCIPIDDSVNADAWTLPTGWYWFEDEDGWNLYEESGHRRFVHAGQVVRVHGDTPPEIVALFRRRNGL